MTTASHNKQIDVALTAHPELVNNSHDMMNDLVNVHLKAELDEILKQINEKEA